MASPRLTPLTFDDLARRLVRDLALFVHSGAVTERRLAIMVGLSQPHLHNVVNGLRKLTPTVADQIMERLDWSLLDLVESTEAHALLSRRQSVLARGREIPLAHCAVGLGFRLPGTSISEIIAPNSWLSRTENPLAVSVGCDPLMEKTLAIGDILLLDQAPAVRSLVASDALYVVRHNGDSLVRWVRPAPRGLYLATSMDASQPLQWPLVVLPASRRFEIIEAKVVALARPPDNTFRLPVLPSVSS